MQKQKREHEVSTIPFVLYDSEIRNRNSMIKWLFGIIIALILALTLSIYLFISFISAYDFVGYEQDGEGINNINSGYQGDVVNGSKITNEN
jgi:hypothetical protein